MLIITKLYKIILILILIVFSFLLIVPDNALGNIYDTLNEIKSIAIATGKLANFIFNIVHTFSKWIGFKVFIFIIITTLFVILFNNTLNFSSKTSFIISLIITAVFWFAWNRFYYPEGNGDIFTILKVVSIVLVLYILIFILKKNSTRILLKVKLKRIIKKRKKLLSLKQKSISPEKFLARFEELYENIRISVYDYAKDTDRDSRTRKKVEIEKLKNEIIKHLKKADI